jgi:MazG family protein
MSDINKLLDVMKQLRNPEGGCPWDIEQDFASIAPYTIEEAYEVADAIERNNMKDLQEELGDLLLQVVFHAQMADEEKLFNFDDVARGIAEKLIYRHPHVFGDKSATTADDVLPIWNEQKKKEKAAKQEAEQARLMDDVPKNFPALKLAHKIQKKAACVGFEWDNMKDVWAKVEEELQEFKEAEASGNKKHTEEELGDLLFAVVNYGRMAGYDCEDALRKANIKFINRFNKMETYINKQGKELSDCSLEEMDNVWDMIKKTA